MEKRRPVDVAVLDMSETTKMMFLQHSISASHQGSFMLELVKSQAMCLVPDGQNPDGSQRFAQLAPNQIVARCAQVTEDAFAEMQKRGWQVELPTIEELRGDMTAQPAGFNSR